MHVYIYGVPILLVAGIKESMFGGENVDMKLYSSTPAYPRPANLLVQNQHCTVFSSFSAQVELSPRVCPPYPNPLPMPIPIPMKKTSTSGVGTFFLSVLFHRNHIVGYFFLFSVSLSSYKNRTHQLVVINFCWGDGCMRCAIRTFDWVCWLGIKVIISGEKVAGDTMPMWPRVQHPSAPLPLSPSPSPSPIPLLRMVWSRICTVLPPIHKLNSKPGLFQQTIHMREIHQCLHLTSTPFGPLDVFCVCSLPQMTSLPLFHVSLGQDLLEENLPNSDCVTAPPASLPSQSPLRMFRPDLYSCLVTFLLQPIFIRCAWSIRRNPEATILLCFFSFFF